MTTPGLLHQLQKLSGAVALYMTLGLLVVAPSHASESGPEYGRDGVVKNGTVQTRIGELTFENGYPSRESVASLYDAMDFQRATQAYVWALPMVSMAEWQAVHEQQFNAQDRDFVIYNCLLYTSPSPRDRTRSRMPSSA